jgi:hypothetical protein
LFSWAIPSETAKEALQSLNDEFLKKISYPLTEEQEEMLEYSFKILEKIPDSLLLYLKDKDFIKQLSPQTRERLLQFFASREGNR